MAENQRKYQVDDLLRLMSCLRDPEYGCPWDKEQTFSSIVPFTLEEVYEVVDAIEMEDHSHLKEELGDLLFQVVFYAQIAKDEQLFEFSDIVDGLVSKFLRRHPHVFPNGTLESFDSLSKGSSDLTHQQLSENWDSVKTLERKEKENIHDEKEGLLDSVPKALPALQRAYKLQAKAAKVGFDWECASFVFKQMMSEIKELEEAIEKQDLASMEDELGDVLFSCVNLSRHLGVQPETALRSTNRKFERRFKHIEQNLKKEGRSLKGATLEEMESLWGEAKAQGL